METAKEQFMDSRPNWEAVMSLRDLENAAYKRLAALVEDGRYTEAGQVIDVLKAVNLV